MNVKPFTDRVLKGKQMLKLARTVGSLLVLLMAAETAPAISLLGPQVDFMADIGLGYDRLVEMPYPFGGYNVFINPEPLYAPQNLQEEYRWSIPTIYYAYDPSFVDYFQSNGVRAVESAIAILNALPRASDMSQDLSEFPLDEAHFNNTARALHLFDLKSAALEMLLARLGLADPERFTWTLRARSLQPGATCPFYDYTVIQRNFDPITFQPSKYVNGNLYTYQILQLCPPPMGPLDRSEAREFLVDPLATVQTAVASPKVSFPDVNYYGVFHAGLTRDDAGAIRYLYSSSNTNFEQAPPEAVLFDTNTPAQILVTSNLTLLAAQALTNNAVALAALYPGLLINSSTNTFTVVNVTNITPIFTNHPWDPAGFFSLEFVTNVTSVPQTLFHHQFGNLITFQFTNGQFVTTQITDIEQVTNHNLVSIQTTEITSPPWAPPGTVFVANNTTRFFATNRVSGEFFILPASACDVKVLGILLTNVLSFTNTVVATNLFGQTNVAGQFFAQSTIDFATNHTLVVQLVNCVSNNISLRLGLEKINFVRRDFESGLGRFWPPITNDYSMLSVTNGQIVRQYFRRVVTRPDILFTAADIPQQGKEVETVNHTVASMPNFNTNGVNGNVPIPLLGPGTIEGPVTLVFNKIGPVRVNSATGFLDEVNAVFYYQWASFDGTTNDPILYPPGLTLQDVESLALIQVTPSFLPAASLGRFYSQTLTVSGGIAPYTWSIAPNTVFPPGLSLTPDPVDSTHATISGTPTVPTITLITVRVTDARGLSIDTVYQLVVQ